MRVLRLPQRRVPVGTAVHQRTSARVLIRPRDQEQVGPPRPSLTPAETAAETTLLRSPPIHFHAGASTEPVIGMSNAPTSRPTRACKLGGGDSPPFSKWIFRGL